MKPQDIAFIVIFIALIIYRKPKLLVAAGLACLLISMPLFAKWIFFTAERLTWYAAAFFLIAILVNLYQLRDNKKNENRNRRKSDGA